MEERLFKDYLLGSLPEDEERRLEERLFTDDVLFEELLIAEDELVDAYLRGDLSQDEGERFRTRFLSTPERHQKLRFASALGRYLSTSSAPAVTRAAPQVRPSIPRTDERPGYWKRLFFTPAFRLAATILFVLGLGLGIWRTFFYQSELDKRVQQLEISLKESRQREKSLKQQLAQQGSRYDDLVQGLEQERSERARLEQELAAQSPSRTNLASFVLLPVSRLRSEGGKPPNLIVPAAAQLIQLKLRFDTEDGYKSYRVELRRRFEEGVLWSQDRLAAQSTTQGQSILSLKITAKTLRASNYRATLYGVSSDAKLERINEYDFSLVFR